MDILILKINKLIENRKYKNENQIIKVRRISKYEKQFKIIYKIELNKRLTLKDLHKITGASIYDLNNFYKKGGFNYVYKELILSNLYINKDA